MVTSLMNQTFDGNVTYGRADVVHWSSVALSDHFEILNLMKFAIVQILSIDVIPYTF